MDSRRKYDKASSVDNSTVAKALTALSVESAKACCGISFLPFSSTNKIPAVKARTVAQMRCMSSAKDCRTAMMCVSSVRSSLNSLLCSNQSATAAPPLMGGCLATRCFLFFFSAHLTYQIISCGRFCIYVIYLNLVHCKYYNQRCYKARNT